MKVFSIAGALGIVAAACSEPVMPDDGGRSAFDIYVRAAEAVPGGALVGVWLPLADDVVVSNPPAGKYDQTAYLVGGYIDVDPSALGAGAAAGRLLGYDGTRTFTTLCTSERPLRAVSGVDGVVIAVGDDGVVLRYTPSTHHCDPVVRVATSGEQPTMRGIAGPVHAAPLVAVGSVGSTHAPVMYEIGPSTITPITVAGTAMGGLNAIAYEPSAGFTAVGENALTIRRGPSDSTWSIDSSAPSPANLYSVSTESESGRRWTMSVGGETQPYILARKIDDVAWQRRTDYRSTLSPLRAVYARSNYEVFEVGLHGANVVYNGLEYYTPPGDPLTTADLVAVAGRGGVIIAAGGDLSNHTATQSAVILIRGSLAAAPTYSVDNTDYTALGRTRADFGLGAGSPQ